MLSLPLLTGIMLTYEEYRKKEKKKNKTDSEKAQMP